ncbi:MAG: DUF3656 domain-containing U32 family peptidase [Coprobacillus cateniformis]|uniref:U32 family peptidase n=1 Tax=Coprobacillus cateniformis TaxID=100884 RepID=UPI003994B177
MKKVELLAPAGDQESLIAAIQNGADAIYLGGTLFNARAFAKNFDDEQLEWAIHYAHLRNVKIYVTVNTLYRDDEFAELIQYLDYLYHIQVDALIVQDIGLFHMIKKRYDDFEIHMSTQASIMNKAAAQYFYEQGASRIVLARENTLEEIQHICKSTSIEVEVFVHGALCVCYSGQCLMSSFIGKRSGNRGECAQPCRLQYRLSKNGKIQPKKVPFLLSPKDLMTIDSIGELIDAGVKSFKVEGRMKKPEYVASVIKAYRKAIDSHLNCQTKTFDDDIFYMKAMFNRNYTKGYIYQDQHIVEGDYPGNKGIIIGKVIGYRKKEKHVIIELDKSLKQGDSLVFEQIDKGRPINKIFINNRLVAKASAGDIAEIEFNYPVYEGNVRKTIDIDVIDTLHHTYDKDYRKQPIEMTFIAHIKQHPQLILQCQDIKVHKTADITVEEAIKTPLDRQRIQQQLCKLGQSTFIAHHINLDIDEQLSMPIKVLNEMRREAIDELTEKLSNRQIHFSVPREQYDLTTIKKSAESQCIHILVSNLKQLEIVLNYNNIDMIYYPFQTDSLEAFHLCIRKQQKFALFIPRICKDKELEIIKQSDVYQQVEAVVVNEYGAYYSCQDKKRIIGTGLNVYNSHAINSYQETKILSLEMSQKQIYQLKCNHQQCFVQIYGKIENMISDYCPISQYYFGYQKKNCQLCKSSQYALIDRKNETFDLMMDEQCRMHLLNCRTLFIEPNNTLDVGGYFIHFTNENREITEFILNQLFSYLYHHKKTNIREKIMTTSGYFKV